MAVGEAITNLLAAPIALDRVKLSCNWMAACGDDPAAPGEDAALYDTVQAVGMELCPALGISVPVGKDSLSMRTRWSDDGGAAQAGDGAGVASSSPRSRRSTTCARTRRRSCSRGDTTLILVDLGARPDAHGRLDAGAGRRASSAPRCPTSTTRSCSRRSSPRVNALRDAGLLLAYHDRSDGGLWAAACEMAFAGHLGVSLNVDLLVTEGDGIADSRAEYGDSKNWAAQVSARREELTLRALFNEELGAVIQVPTARRDEAMRMPARRTA